MTFQSVPETAEAVITYSGHGKTFKNIVHGTKLGGYDLADLVVLASAVDLAINDDWLPIQSADYLYVSTVVRGLEFENDQEVTNAVSSAAGAIAGNALPDNVTLAIKKASAFTGRTARGRLYWIATTYAQIATNENQYTIPGSDDIRDAVEAMRAAITATVWTAAIVSRFLDNVKRPTGTTKEWVNTVLVDIDVDSQRGRLL